MQGCFGLRLKLIVFFAESAGKALHGQKKSSLEARFGGSILSAGLSVDVNTEIRVKFERLKKSF